MRRVKKHGRRFKLSKSKYLFSTISVLFLILVFSADEDTLLYAQTPESHLKRARVITDFENHLGIFIDRLTPLLKEERNTIFGKYLSLIDREFDLEKLYLSTGLALNMLLDSAVSARIDILTLFTLPAVQKCGKAVVLEQGQLARINQQYNLHGLFLISAPDADSSTSVNMTFLIIGQGRMITGYDKKADIRHPEYNFVTGRYEYHELFSMTAVTDNDGSCGLYDIKGLSDPSGTYQWMRGPLNSKIKSLSIPAALRKNRAILVQYEFFGINTKIVPCIPIEKL